MFCEKCGSMMFPQSGVYVCRQCGAEKEIGTDNKTIRTASKDRMTTVIEDDTATLPKTRVLCPECGHSEAFFVIRQTRAADEPETRIYRCCKCNHTWREYRCSRRSSSPTPSRAWSTSSPRSSTRSSSRSPPTG